MYTYNRIHNDYDNNVVRVELNSSYIPRTYRETSREPKSRKSSINRNETFTKSDKPSNIIRSETFILKHHNDDSSDERADYNGTYTRSRNKSHGSNETKYDDKYKYDTYIRGKFEKKDSDNDQPLYINTDTYRKSRKSRSSLSQESENLNSNTFTKSSKPKRVESLIKRFDMSFWRRNKESKDKSPSPSSTDTYKRSKNIFNLITSGKKLTRDVGVECKMDDDQDYYTGMGTRKSSIQSLIQPEQRYQRAKRSYRNENNDSQHIASLSKSGDRRLYESNKKSVTSMPAPIKVEIGLRNVNKDPSDYKLKRKPIGIASPQPQIRNRSALKSGTIRISDNKSSHYPQGTHEKKYFNRENAERTSFRDYRDKLKLKNEQRRVTDNSDDDLRKSYQRSFFVPM